MKGLKEFLELLKKDKGLMAEVEKVEDNSAKVVEIAKKYGYEFTEDEFNDLKMAAVSGGVNFAGAMKGLIGKVVDFSKTDKGKEMLDKSKKILERFKK